MNFSSRFQKGWWIFLLFLFSGILILLIFKPAWVGIDQQLFYYRYTILLVLILLFLVPLFIEVSIFGIGVKRELRALRSEVNQQAASNRLYWLGNDLASLRFQSQINIPPEEKHQLVDWQGQQALAHARAARLPQGLIHRIQTALDTYLAAPNPVNAATFATEILNIQREIAGFFQQEDAGERSS